MFPSRASCTIAYVINRAAVCAHRRTPRLAIVSTEEKKTAARRSVNGGSINPVWRFPVGDDHVCKTAAVSTVCRQEILAAVMRDHHAVIVGADVDRLRTRRVNCN